MHFSCLPCPTHLILLVLTCLKKRNCYTSELKPESEKFIIASKLLGWFYLHSHTSRAYILWYSFKKKHFYSWIRLKPIIKYL
jgi:hypothetical protein